MKTKSQVPPNGNAAATSRQSKKRRPVKARRPEPPASLLNRESLQLLFDGPKGMRLWAYPTGGFVMEDGTGLPAGGLAGDAIDWWIKSGANVASAAQRIAVAAAFLRALDIEAARADRRDSVAAGQEAGSRRAEEAPAPARPTAEPLTAQDDPLEWSARNAGPVLLDAEEAAVEQLTALRGLIDPQFDGNGVQPAVALAIYYGNLFMEAINHAHDLARTKLAGVRVEAA